MKKLLILGASANEISLVKRAQDLGYYVVVTDYNTDYDLSPAKYYSDEAWDISWSDLDALEKRCYARGIGGVIAGYSEFRVENMIKLCDRLGLPSYATMEQLEITRDKIKFKNACRQYGVPVVDEYDAPECVDSFPVIVKPTDRAGSIGISIATDKKELDQAYRYAMDMSVTKKVIIEKYIRDDQGVKVDFYYAVENGKITLISTCDTIQAENNGTSKVIQSAWIYPSRYAQEACSQVDAKLRSMISGMGIQWGCIFFSGFMDQTNHMSFFECGFRLEGGHQYGYVERRGLFNFLDLFILYAMEGHTKGMSRGKTLNKELKAVTINLYAKEGTIKEIKGFDQIAALEDCSLALVQGRTGQSCKGDSAILSKAGMFAFCHTDAKALQRDIELAYTLAQVCDTDGNDMIYDRISTDKISSWWS